MQPILHKLMSDAGILLTDFWRACRHLPPSGENERLPHLFRAGESSRTFCASAEGQSRNDDGLCYFHLN
jgi:hypothetical protein